MEKPLPLNLVSKLCQALDEERIAYCHWKSNQALDRSASGDNDLDLLVSRSDVDRFSEILYAHSFKEAHSPVDQQLPGVQDYYGYDPSSGKIIHVHAHFQLVFGHDMSKNYHLPVEKPYLQDAIQGELFKVPAPELEFVVFVIRMMIKHSTWDTILAGQGTLSSSERQEFVYLEDRVNRDKLREVIAEHLPFVGAPLLEDCVQSLRPGCPAWKRIQIGQRLQNSLKPYARRTGITDLFLKLWRRVVNSFQRRVLRHTARARLASGGAMIAIVGGDGAGKSTAVNGINEWLSPDFEISTVHLGKPPWSLTTILIRGLIKIGRTLGFYPFERAPIEYTLDSNSLVFPGYPWMIREVCTARDRYLTYKKARRFASNGGLVICDRFPISQVQLMDGPQVERMTSNYPTNPFIKYLSRLEKKYYQPIKYPELLIVLRADPILSAQRKTDEDSESVVARSSEIWNLDWSQLPACIIDANQPKAEVLSELKALIWASL